VAKSAIRNCFLHSISNIAFGRRDVQISAGTFFKIAVTYKGLATQGTDTIYI